MPWWSILLIVFAVLFLIGLIPIGVDASYYEAFRLKIKIWLFSFTIIPLKKKPKKTPKKEKPQKEKKSDKPEKPKQKPDLQTLRSYAELAFELLGDLREKLVLNLLSLHVYFGGDDAARQAISYGRAWAVIGALMPLINQTFTVKKQDVAPVMAQSDKKIEFDARIVCTLTISKSLSLALHALLGYLKHKNKKKGENNDESSSVRNNSAIHEQDSGND